jgi:hypothetical protein
VGEAAHFEAVREGLSQPQLGLYFAPIRHHSPACAWAVRELIREVRPRRVLVEAPVDMVQHVDTLLAPETKPPVAIAALVERPEETRATARLVSYYPFCAHSPEYIALVEGREIGAEIGFIDLPASAKAMCSTERPDAPLAFDDETYFDSGDFVARLCRKLGCRDGFELWDHLFESRLGDADWRGLLANVGAYCAGLRQATPAETLEQTGDEAREAHMSAAVREALEAGGPVVVVAGGFHVPALLDAIALGAVAPAKSTAEAPAKSAGGECRSYLIRYSFAALDALSGYAAGLPQPGYYDYLWRRSNESCGELPWRRTALDLVSAFCAQVRSDGYGVSVPAQVEILRAAEALAGMRGRAGAGRHDLIDGVQTALVKGESGAREAWTERLLDFLRGTAIGDVPASAGSPPLVEDARTRARSLRIDVSDGSRRRRRLDIRRKPAHLAASRYFHAMRLLETSFAEREAGPDFLNDVETERLFEEWSYAWSPQVEGRLIELAAFGDRLPDVCLQAIERRRSEMRESGHSRDIAGMAGLVVEGLLAGLGAELAGFLRELASDIQNHGDFAAVAHALRRLHAIARSAGPLCSPEELSLDGVRLSAYQRLVFLCDDLPSSPEESIPARLEALRLVAELLRQPGGDLFDADQFDDAVDRVAGARPPAELLGAVLALSVQSSRRDVSELCDAISGSFQGTVEQPQERVGVLRGLLFIAPELAWRQPELLERIDGLLCDLGEEEFLELLPHIRLAFTALNPRETDRLAEMLARLHGGRAGDFASRSYDLSTNDLERGLRVERALLESLTGDGLGAWLGEPA